MQRSTLILSATACGLLMLVGSTAQAYRCKDDAVKKAIVRHENKREGRLDPYPRDRMPLTGRSYFWSRDGYNGQVKRGGGVQTISFGAVNSRVVFRATRSDNGTAGIKVTVCGYTWPGKKSEWATKFRPDNLTVRTETSFVLDKTTPVGGSVHKVAPGGKRTAYIAIIEPQSRVRTLKFNLKASKK